MFDAPIEAPATTHQDRQIALYSVEVSNGLRTFDVLVPAASATEAMIQAEETVTLATREMYHYTGRFTFAALH